MSGKTPVAEFVRTVLAAHESLVHVEELPEKSPKYAELSRPLSEPLRRWLDSKGIKPYLHQAQAIDLILQGKNVAITTPTASGKTLAFNLPVFHLLRQDPQATALYMYPMKALTNDQLQTLRKLERETGISVRSAVYDGDTPPGVRKRIRERSRVVLTNPYALHQYLPWHLRWQHFLSNLKLVVVDEAHVYRGVFGSNVAMLLRRLRKICNHYGSSPQWVISSATIANPQELSQRLTGEPFEVVCEDGSGRGRKFFCFWNPPFLDERKFTRRSSHQETKDLLMLHLRHGIQTLCFAVSRRGAELLSKWVADGLKSEGSPLADRVSAYRAGYLPEQRREIERRFREGHLKGVVSTDALEIGIDIGALDAVITSGYPGTIISTWQQAGRSGRGTEDSLATLVAFDSPLDQYLMRHPRRFFASSPENATISTENEQILTGHLMCAAAELPVGPGDKKYFGDLIRSGIKALEEELLLQPTPNGAVYAGTARPSEVVKLNNISDQVISVVCEGELLETMDPPRAHREAHPGAVLLHEGETYVVRRLDLTNGVAEVEHKDVDYYTQVTERHEISVREQLQEKSDPTQLYLGEVLVTEHHPSYSVKKFDRVIGKHSLDLPPVTFPTVALWWVVPPEIVRELEAEGGNLAGGLHAVEHGLIAMAPLHAMCDPWDLGGESSALHQSTHQPTVFLYDAYEGGIGIAQKCFELFPELARTTLELIRDCECGEGCPSCVYSARCGSSNSPMDKRAAILILGASIL